MKQSKVQTIISYLINIACMGALWFCGSAAACVVSDEDSEEQFLDSGASLVQVECLSNGFISAMLLTVETPESNLKTLKPVLADLAKHYYRAYPEIASLDIVAYDGKASKYAIPFFTVSVPKQRFTDFIAFAEKDKAYDRYWWRKNTSRYAAKPSRGAEYTLWERMAVGLDGLNARWRGGLYDGLLYRSEDTHCMALTIDDAPHPMYTPLLLDTLRRLNIKASIFVIGRNVMMYPYYLQDIYHAGHELANHTFHHERLDTVSGDYLRRELKTTNQQVYYLTGYVMRYFRPPGGTYNPQTIEVAKSLGLTTVFWSTNLADYTQLSKYHLLERFSKQVSAGGIALIHDNVPVSLHALPEMKAIAAQKGIRLCSIEEFLHP